MGGGVGVRMGPTNRVECRQTLPSDTIVRAKTKKKKRGSIGSWVFVAGVVLGGGGGWTGAGAFMLFGGWGRRGGVGIHTIVCTAPRPQLLAALKSSLRFALLFFYPWAFITGWVGYLCSSMGGAQFVVRERSVCVCVCVFVCERDQEGGRREDTRPCDTSDKRVSRACGFKKKRVTGNVVEIRVNKGIRKRRGWRPHVLFVAMPSQGRGEGEGWRERGRGVEYSNWNGIKLFLFVFVFLLLNLCTWVCEARVCGGGGCAFGAHGRVCVCVCEEWGTGGGERRPKWNHGEKRYGSVDVRRNHFVCPVYETRGGGGVVEGRWWEEGKRSENCRIEHGHRCGGRSQDAQGWCVGVCVGVK